MTISLSENKSTAWSESIGKILDDGIVSTKELEINIGRLVHLGLVLPSVHHFLSRLHELHRRALNRRHVKVTTIYAKDLKLMIYFLEKAKDGVDINMIVYQKPTHAYISDSCPMCLSLSSTDIKTKKILSKLMVEASFCR